MLIQKARDTAGQYSILYSNIWKLENVWWSETLDTLYTYALNIWLNLLVFCAGGSNTNAYVKTNTNYSTERGYEYGLEDDEDYEEYYDQ